MTYIFINPVVDSMYIKKELDELLLRNGYTRVAVKEDWHKIVKDKYNKALKSTGKTILDRRCPLAIDTITEYISDNDTFIPEIDPILIHCGIEIANMEDLRGHQKIITTPCESLASYGNSTSNPNSYVAFGVNNVNTIVDGIKGTEWHTYDINSVSGVHTLKVDDVTADIPQNQGTSQYLTMTGITTGTPASTLVYIMYIKQFMYKKLSIIFCLVCG